MSRLFLPKWRDGRDTFFVLIDFVRSLAYNIKQSYIDNNA